MELVVSPAGEVRCIYDETIELHILGNLRIQRASHVEPTPEGGWQADLSPVNGPTLGPFVLRTQAVAAEIGWLEQHWLVGSPASPDR